MAFLKHSLNGQVISVYELQGNLRIGRRGDCQIKLDDPTVSNSHAELFCEAGEWKLKDLNSTNGVRVDGEKRLTATLVDGNVISLGTHEFEFLVAAPNELDKTLKIKKSWIPGVYYTE